MESKEELRLAHIHDPEKNYLVRICMLVADAIIVDRSRSVIQMCDECERDVWVDTKQEIPAPPEGGPPFEGQYNLCIECSLLHTNAQEELSSGSTEEGGHNAHE